MANVLDMNNKTNTNRNEPSTPPNMNATRPGETRGTERGGAESQAMKAAQRSGERMKRNEAGNDIINK